MAINILVTGSAGFVGRHMMTRLRNNPLVDKVGGMDNYDPICGSQRIEATRMYTRVRDVTKFDDVVEMVDSERITHIIHLAAYGRNLSCADYPRHAYEVNVMGTLNVLEVAQQYGVRVTVCSSNIVLSDRNTIYKNTKKAVEDLIVVYADRGVSCQGIRPSNIYGAGQSRTEYQPCAFAGLDCAYEKEKQFTISGDGTQTRDWVHVEDVARAFETVLFSDVRGDTIDVCTGIQTSMNKIAAWLGVPVKYTDSRPGDAMELISDPTMMEATFGFETTHAIEDYIFDAFPAVAKARGRKE